MRISVGQEEINSNNNNDFCRAQYPIKTELMVFYNSFSHTMTHSKTCRTPHHIPDQSTKHTLTTTTKEGGEGGTVTPKALHPNHAYLPLVRISSLERANVNTRGSGEVDSDDLVVVHADRAEEVTLDIDVHDGFSTQG